MRACPTLLYATAFACCMQYVACQEGRVYLDRIECERATPGSDTDDLNVYVAGKLVIHDQQIVEVSANGMVWTRGHKLSNNGGMGYKFDVTRELEIKLEEDDGWCCDDYICKFFNNKIGTCRHLAHKIRAIEWS